MASDYHLKLARVTPLIVLKIRWILFAWKLGGTTVTRPFVQAHEGIFFIPSFSNQQFK